MTKVYMSSEYWEVFSDWKQNVILNSRFSPRPPSLKGSMVSVCGMEARGPCKSTNRRETLQAASGHRWVVKCL